jgi:hypothetical protein
MYISPEYLVYLGLFPAVLFNEISYVIVFDRGIFIIGVRDNDTLESL